MKAPTLIYLVTRNLHKVEEFKRMLAKEKFQFLDLNMAERQIPEHPNVQWIEDGSTFFENAAIKVRALAKYLPQHWIIADDSGLCVDALNGEPGVYSSRYAGENASDEQNIAKLLSALKKTKSRKAHFHCSLVLHSPTGGLLHFEGKCPGEIAESPSGEEGFGYDPIFIPDGFDKTFANLNPVDKDRISHRGHAFQLFEAFASKNF